jgi:TolA-binding protein
VTNPTSEEDELAGIMSLPDTDKKPTAQARILFAKAELARIHRKSDTQHDYLLQIATKFKPEQLSPTLLGEAGDCLLADKKPEAADPFYQYIIDQYADSPLIDFAYNGLGQIAYDNKDYEKALFYYNKALDEGLATTRLKDITLGKAKSLLALGRLDEAKPVFEEVASTREWRGECTAYSVLCLGDIQMTKQHYPEANAYYQRVYLAYQKYPEIEAEAYLKSGEAFEKMSKVQEAKNTYLEMLRNTALAQYPQFADARNQLEHLTQ